MLRFVVLLVVLFCAAAMPVWSVEVILSPPGADGWKPLVFPKIARHTTYTVIQEDGTPALRAQGDCSASALYLPTPTVDLGQTPKLHWRWKIEHGLPAHDEHVKAGDDFAARVYVMFQFDAAHASFWERARHRLAAAVYGDNVPGNAINYVWSSRQPAGATWTNPYGSGSKMLSLGSGPLPQWSDVTVDVVADYVALYSQEPPPMLAVALMTDADDLCQQATAYYADFRFLSR